MTLNLGVIGKKWEPSIQEYDWKDCALYALGIGATEKDLEFVYEGATGGMKVYPTFAVYFIVEPLLLFMDRAGIDLTGVLHFGHKITLNHKISPEGKLVTTTIGKSIYDKGTAALVNVEFETRDERDVVLFTNDVTVFCRGQGNFGGDPGPKVLRFAPSQGSEPVFTASYPVPERQAVIYRLSGDLNPLHIDPGAARKAGFAKPVLHGLCSFGYVGRAVLKKLCGGDVSRFREFKARFASPVFPGDTLTVKGWGTNDAGLYLILAETGNGVVLDQSYVRIS